MANTCKQTTRRMIELMLSSRVLTLLVGFEALAADGDRVDDDITYEQMGLKIRRMIFKLRAEAKRENNRVLDKFTEFRNLDQVNWATVAHAVMCATNPAIMDEAVQQAAVHARLN